MLWMQEQLAEIAAARFFPLLMVIAGAVDVMTLRIPNRIVLTLVLGFGVLVATTDMPLWILALHLGTALVLLGLGFVFFQMGLIGGGDAKLLAAAGLWLGFPCVLPFILFTAVAGGVLAAAIGVLFLVNLEAGIHSARYGRIASSLSADVPYGFAIAVGAILTMPLTWWFGLASP